MKRHRQEHIKRLVSARAIGTQQELAEALAGLGVAATQSSVSRDIVELGLIKVNGAYRVPAPSADTGMPAVEFKTAGDNLIVATTEVGQAQPVAITIDRAAIAGIVGTVAGDDTILIAVRDAQAQRAAIARLETLFGAPRRASLARRNGRARRGAAMRG
jgi:transcriptional regulator of arginine metabolism